MLLAPHQAPVTAMTIEPMEIIQPPWLSLNPIARIRGARMGMMIMTARVEAKTDRKIARRVMASTQFNNASHSHIIVAFRGRASLGVAGDDAYQIGMSTTPAPLADRIALVVGASRGIGYESALALAKAGAHVVATARTQGGLEELDDAIFAATGKHATLVPFDLVDGGAVDRLGGAIFERFKKLDVWVHAAATMGPSGLTPVSHADPREFAKVEKTNFTAVYRLIRSLEPLLRASDAGRAIHFTTSVATNPRAFWGMYAATKAGAEALVKAWADEIESTPVRVSIVDPGRMRTAMRAQAYPGEDPSVLPHPSEIGPLVVDLARPDAIPPLTIRFRDWKSGPSTEALI